MSGGRLAAAGTVVAIVLLFLIRSIFPDTFFALTRPLWSLGDSLSASVGTLIKPSEDLNALKAERDALLGELEAERNKNAVLTAQSVDLGRLSDTAGRIIAGVLVRPPVSPYDTLVVSVGTREGVRVGARAYGPGGVPIGVVELVSGENAHIALYSSAGKETQGWIGETRIPITLLGFGGGTFRASISKDAPVTVGEQVLIPGPGALPVGTVARIDADPSSPTALVYIRPLTSPFTITFVAIDRTLP